MKHSGTARVRVSTMALGLAASLACHPALSQQLGGPSLRGVEVVVEEPVNVTDAAARVSSTPSATARGAASGQSAGSVSQPPVVAGPTIGQATRSTTPARPNAATTQPLAQGWMDRRVFRDDAVFTSARLCAQLANQAVRTSADKALGDFLIAKVRAGLPGGFGTHSESYNRLGSCSAEASVNVAARRLVVNVTARRSRFFVRITTPDAPVVGGLSGELDPNYGIDYDFHIRAMFILPTQVGGQLVQESVHYSATNISEPQTSSVTGNLMLAANSIVRFMGGPDFTAAIPREVHFSHGSLVSLDLAALNQPLTQRLPPNARIDIVPNADRNLLLRVTTRPLGPGPVVN